MAYSFSFRLLTVSALGFALLDGCCANNVCNCKDATEDVIKLVFAPTFTAADLDTITIQRYPLVVDRTTKSDVVVLIRTAAQARDTIYLNNNTPFAQVGTNRLSQYHYVVRYHVGPRLARPTTTLVIDNVELKGSFDGDGCCTCYFNTKKVMTFRKDSASTASTVNLKPNPVFTITK